MKASYGREIYPLGHQPRVSQVLSYSLVSHTTANAICYWLSVVDFDTGKEFLAYERVDSDIIQQAVVISSCQGLIAP